MTQQVPDNQEVKHTHQPEIGVLVMAYGTPASPQEIEAYYTHIRRGRRPTPELLAELQQRYAAIGGTSPLMERTQAQVNGLQSALNQLAPGHYLVTSGMKHAPPFIEDSLAELVHSGIQQVIGLVLAPHYSMLSVGEYAERVHKANTSGIPFNMIKHWHQAAGYVRFLAREVQSTRAKLAEETEIAPENIAVIFTAHSLPSRILEVGDPYAAQLQETASMVAAQAQLTHWSTAWQSAGRTPEPWLGPNLLDLLTELHRSHVQGALVCPAGFVSDHLEILYDLDIEAQQVAERLGMPYARTRLPNNDPDFLATLAEVVHTQRVVLHA
jgi:ferrochelatase